MRNEALRAAAASRGVKLWEIADRIGMTDGNFSRKLRKELPIAERDRLIALVYQLAEEHEHAG